MEIKTSDLLNWGWADLAPWYAGLEAQNLGEANVEGWLRKWSEASALSDELYNRLFVATTVNTADQAAESRFAAYMGETYPQVQTLENELKKKLIASGLTIAGMRVPLRNMRAEADLFREENLALEAREERLNTEHDKIVGAQSVEWQGEQKTMQQMLAILRQPDRQVRRAAWEKLASRQLEDREAINQQWVDYMGLRQQIARNSGKENYRAYRWQQLMRFDYTPQDCQAFHRAIEEVVVPAVARLMQRRRQKLGIKELRYFDIFVDLSGKPALAPFENVRELTEKASAIFHHVHDEFGSFFDTMMREGLLDLESRANKAAGGYCTQFAHTERPFIFANAVGIHDDVQTLLHEGGHAFHAFETFKLPYFHQYAESALPMEFAEVASMGMEYLCLPYQEEEYGGFYSGKDAARARVDHIEGSLVFWPYMAMVDSFQQWAYENFKDGTDPDQCDQKWMELENRFRPYLDWSGYEDVMKTGWHRKDHIHQAPFYYIEYGLAQLGAVQIWANALEDQTRAVEQYRQALLLGGTATLPELFQTAGAKFTFDAHTLKQAVGLMEGTINQLERTY